MPPERNEAFILGHNNTETDCRISHSDFEVRHFSVQSKTECFGCFRKSYIHTK